MSRLFWRSVMCSLVCSAWLLASGCNEKEDRRNTDEKMYAPTPDIKTRHYMACPKCGCPQMPYRITELKNYYRCSGNPPKFAYHKEHLYQHTLSADGKKGTQY